MRPAARSSACSRYRVRLLHQATIAARGVEHGVPGERVLLPWDEIRCVIAAEVGEPEGVRTIVFDLLAADDAGRWIAFRAGAEPGEEAMELARSLQIGMGIERASASLKSLASDAIPTRWYPDLETFEDDARSLLREFVATRA
jgi:hypothetical protein